MLTILLIALAYLFLFITIEFVTRRTRLNRELSRKIAHILAGTSAAFLPLIVSFRQILILSILFLIIMLLSKQKNLFSSIHEVNRKTYGEIFFPLSIFITALFFPTPTVFMYGVLVMSISDGFASVVGQKYGKRKLPITSSEKTLIGSMTFLVTALSLGIMLVPSRSFINVVVACAIAWTLTVTEAVLSSGLDNLLLPPIAALLFKLFTR